MKYSFIAQQKKTWPIDLMCRTLGVKRNGYYRFQKHRRNKSEDQAHQALLQCVKDIDVASDHSYGSRRMQQALDGCGYSFGRGKTRSLMKDADVQVRYRKKYKVTTNSQHSQPVFNNLLNRPFEVDQPNRVYASDVTYIWTQEGWLYLAVVLDLYSRKVVGWSMSSRMKAELVCDALTMAIWQRRPDSPFRSRRSICEQSVSTLTGDPWLPRQHEPERQLLGQLRGGKLLWQLEAGARAMAKLSNPV